MAALTAALVEREKELAQLDAVIERTLTGVGGAVVVEGPAGIGKSSLLREAQRRAAGRGMQVLSAHGGELEHQSAFGVVRQLFAPVLDRTSEEDRRALPSGVAGAALRALRLGQGDDPEAATAVSEPDVHHGLYWLCSDLAECGPLMIAVDDAQWADLPSLGWIAYLARRLEDLPVVLVVSIRSSEPHQSLSALAELRADPNTLTLRPQPLSGAAVADVLRRLWSTEPHEDFVRACTEASGGNPFILRVLIKAAIDEGLLPTAGDVSRLERVVPTEIAEAILARIAKLPSRPVELARAVAVLGDKGELRHAAALAGLDERQAATAADDLVGADLLRPGPPLQFTHALVRRAVYAAIPVFERRLAHRRAGLLLDSEAQPAEAVAAHLLESEPAGDGWAVEVLRRAAAAAGAAGAPDTAIAYLRRALLEPPPEGVAGELLAELGSLEARAGDSRAVEHLTRALEVTNDASAKAPLVLTLGETLVLAGRPEEGCRLVRELLNTAQNLDREVRLLLEVILLQSSQILKHGRQEFAACLERVSAEVAGGSTPAERRVLVFLTLESLYANRPARYVAELGRRALAGGHLLAEVTSESIHYYYVVNALAFCGELSLATAAVDAAVHEARAGGSAAGLCHVTLSRCVLHRERGDIRNLEAEASVGFDMSRVLGWSLLQPIFAAFLAEALIERGKLEAANDLLERTPCGGPAAFFVTGSRGRLNLAMGRAEQAVEELLASGRDQLAIGYLSPSQYPWRSPAAVALARIGEVEEARRLAAEELALAEAFGTARAIGVALGALAHVEPDEQRRIELLRRAEKVLEKSLAPLELARTRADLGTALRRANMPMEARVPLQRALDAAHHCGATALAQRCWTELWASGARPRRAVTTGLDALTPSQLRVAQLAREGLTIREIAQALFVSRKTVEKHLGHVYSKLGVHSREELQQRTEQPLQIAGDFPSGEVPS